MIMVVFTMALIALLVDAIAVGFARVPLAGLPLLALYTIPVAVLTSGVPFLGFVAGASAFVAMLMVDERDRLTHWGRLVSRQANPNSPARIDTTGLGATGRRVSAAALGAAVVLPIFLPTLPSALLDNGRGPGGDGNGTTISFKDPMVTLADDLKRDEEIDLVRVRSERSPEYLRLVVLDTPTPNAWQASRVDLSDSEQISSIQYGLPLPGGMGPDVPSKGRNYDITLTDDFPDDSTWLPVPYNLKAISADPEDFAYVRSDQTVTVRDDDAIDRTTDYRVSYDEINPTPEQLREAPEPPAEHFPGVCRGARRRTGRRSRDRRGLDAGHADEVRRRGRHPEPLPPVGRLPLRPRRRLRLRLLGDG